MAWNLSMLPQAAKQLAKLDKTVGARVGDAITALTHYSRPSGCKKLVGVNAWRIRVGDWCVIYQIHDDRLIVLVIRIGHRRDV
jgi:mRNA interferase RelE/StbE